jgi:Meiotically up-regulated gene 113
VSDQVALFRRGGVIWARATIAGESRRWSLRTGDETVARRRLALDGQVGLTLTRRSATARSRRSVVYFIAQRGLVKIGFTQDIVLRLKHLQAASPVPLRLLFMLRGRASLEASLHARFRDLRCHNERFRLEGALLDHCRHRIGPSSPALLSCIPGGDDAQA